MYVGLVGGFAVVGAFVGSPLGFKVVGFDVGGYDDDMIQLFLN